MDPAMQHTDTRKTRTLTDKAEEQFENKCSVYSSKLSNSNSDIKALLSEIDKSLNDSSTLEKLKSDLLETQAKHDSLFQEYKDFLCRIKTDKSSIEHDRVVSEYDNIKRDLNYGLRNIFTYLQDLSNETHSKSKHLIDQAEDNSTVNLESQNKVCLFTENKPQDKTSEIESSSPSSSHTTSSRRSSVIAKAKAKAEAAKVRAEFMEREAKLLKQKTLLSEKQAVDHAKLDREKADLDIDLELLATQKEVAVVEAEVEVLQSELSDHLSQNLSVKPPISNKDKTEAYVEHLENLNELANNPASILNPYASPYQNTHNMYQISQGDQLFPPPLTSSPSQVPLTMPNYYAVSNPSASNQPQIPDPPPVSVMAGTFAVPSVTSSYPVYSVPPPTLSSIGAISIPSYSVPDPIQAASVVSLARPMLTVNTGPRYSPPVQNVRSVNEQNENQAFASDFTRFLLKKDLMLSRFSKFNDKAEYYPSWKSSFKAIITEVQAISSEEIDLLAKWTGPQSQRHVLSIKAANSLTPEKGLKLIWEILDERYGSPELIDQALKAKLASIPKITPKDYKKLYDLSDILSEISSVKENDNYRAMFSYFDSSVGVSPIVAKLPYQLQERWTTKAVDYNKKHLTSYPPFSVFAQFIREQSKIKNNPSFIYDSQGGNIKPGQVPSGKGKLSDIYSKKTDLVENRGQTRLSPNPVNICPIHGTRHTLNQCRTFKSKPFFERKKYLQQNKICYRCCISTEHLKRDCKIPIKCDDCDSTFHATALHIKTKTGNAKPKIEQVQNESSQGLENHGGERRNDTIVANAKRTHLNFTGKSCAKIVLVNVYTEDCPDNKLKVYATIDDQSNRTLAKSALFDYFGASDISEYTLSTCSGKSHTSGRQLNNLVVEPIDGSDKYHLLNVLECDQIPEFTEEIPTPEVATCYPHLSDIANLIPNLDCEARILLLIGRDLTDVHHVLDQRIGPSNSPYAQKLPLGWTIIGETCLGQVHHPPTMNVKKTYLFSNDRLSLFEPCPSSINVSKESICNVAKQDNDNFGSQVFVKTVDDDSPGLSRDDREFLEIMSDGMHKNDSGNWSAPLPFRKNRQKLPNNRVHALKRAKSLDAGLKKDSQKRDHFLKFMQAIFDNGHAEPAPDISDDQERWYLPIFAVYHPKKPDSLRAVFDSSAKFDNVSLNDVLLTGPDLSNNLLGVLLRFRREQVAVMTDIQQMFYSFNVDPSHRDYLRFLWYDNNDFEKPLKEYRMTVHVFGNSPSPAIATYGLRKTAMECVATHGSDVLDFVENNFYVDDGLFSVSTASQAIDLIKRTQSGLKSNGNLHLHKISSNSEIVMSSFPSEDLAKGLQDLDLNSSTLPAQRSLGMKWDLQTDSFMFNISREQKAYTRRGILSTINSVYDPLGYLAPVLVKGKLLLRFLMCETVDWDEPLSAEFHDEWEKWRESLLCLEEIRFPRMFISNYSECDEKTIHMFCDASEDVIAAVAYVISRLGSRMNTGFIMGKAKVAPRHGHTIPRLELCAAVLAVEIGQFVSRQLGFSLSEIRYHSDSKIVLGYICNSSRRFYTYVSNRVAKINSLSQPNQWMYIHTEKNPADVATRSITPMDLKNSLWISGPPQLPIPDHVVDQSYDLQNPDSDGEIRPEVTVCKTINKQNCIGSLGSHRFKRFSSWKSLVRALSFLKCFVKKGLESKSVSMRAETETLIIRTVQHELLAEEFQNIRQGRPLSRQSSIWKLDPFLDSNGILRVGGRIKNVDLSANVRNPIIIPRQSWVATLLIRHYHAEVKHQGRHFTSGSLRLAGYWIIGSKQLISSVLYKCVICRRMRKTVEQQKMADLPKDRLTPGPPFTSIGIDTFGPWTVVTRRTRGGTANPKRWAILFTCMASRGVHLEVVEDMSSSSFINAFKRFVAIRGAVKIIRSDRGTNFIGATDDLKINAINVEDGEVKEYLYDNGIEWLFNPPHSSHMGGSWERLIGVTRRILDAMMLEIPGKELTHEVLVTFLAEVSAIINSRPLTTVSNDSEEPFPLTPSLLITQKPDVLIPNVSYDTKDLHRAQWKRVQYLADVFWQRWKTEYVHTLQERRKWTTKSENLREGDVILLKDKQCHRISWPIGRITKVFPSSDGIVRKVEICIVRNEGKTTKLSNFIRPISEVVLLVPNV